GVAKPDLAPAASGGEAVDMFRRLTQAVLALPEPYRGTLLLRYLQDRTPGAIAAESGVPVRTVKTRLQRGLALLRRDLARERSDWRSALAAACGIDELLTTTAAFAAGALLMGTATKVAIGIAAAAALGWWLASAGAPHAAHADVAAAPTGLAPVRAIAAADNAKQEAAPERVAVISSTTNPGERLATVVGR